MFLLRIQGEFGGSKITLLGQNKFGACFYALKRKSELTFSMTENAKSLNSYQNTLRFHVFWSKIGICWISGSKVDLAPQLRSSSEISIIFCTESALYDVSLIQWYFGESFLHIQPESMISIILKHRKLSQLNFEHHIWEWLDLLNFI